MEEIAEGGEKEEPTGKGEDSYSYQLIASMNCYYVYYWLHYYYYTPRLHRAFAPLVRTPVYIYIYICICVTHIYIYIYTQTCIHMYTYTYTHVNSSNHNRNAPFPLPVRALGPRPTASARRDPFCN